jgi:hypothetical protein|eukprot:COSAG01_NODE_6401_length_3687_cov_4.704013_5_plen_59_part_00
MRELSFRAVGKTTQAIYWLIALLLICFRLRYSSRLARRFSYVRGVPEQCACALRELPS